MRPVQNRRIRSRNNNRKGPNPLTRSYESNGPDVKIRGTAQHVAEKYSQLARDAQVSGDPVAAENYLQHAEHYYRIIASAQSQLQQAYGGYQRPFDDNGDDGGEGDDEPASGFGYGHPAIQDPGAPQPEIRPQPEENGYAPRPHQPYRDRGDRPERPPFNRGDRPEVGGQDRRDRFRPRFSPPAEPTGDDKDGAGLPAFLTAPLRQPISVEEANGQEPGFPGHQAEGEGEANGRHPLRGRRRRGRGRFGGERPEGESSSGEGEPSGNDGPNTPLE